MDHTCSQTPPRGTMVAYTMRANAPRYNAKSLTENDKTHRPGCSTGSVGRQPGENRRGSTELYPRLDQRPRPEARVFAHERRVLGREHDRLVCGARREHPHRQTRRQPLMAVASRGGSAMSAVGVKLTHCARVEHFRA